MRPLALACALCFAPLCATATAAAPDGQPDASGERSALDDWSFIPIVFYTPETALGFGAAVIHSFDPSDGGTSRLSTLAAGVIATTREQLILRLEPEIHLADATLQGVLRFQRFPTRFFGDGAALGDPGEPFDELSLMSYMDVRYRLGAADGPLADLSGGLRCEVRWARVTELEDGGVLESEDPLGLDPWVDFGCGPVLAWDSRDDVRNPRRGLYAQLRLIGHTALYGESFTGLSTDLDLRLFTDLGHRHVFATQLAWRSTLGDLPFQLWPRLGGSSLHRGWFDGHLRGAHSLLAQVEWRFPLVWKLGATVFGSVGQAFDAFDEVSLDGLRFAGGAGLRFLLNERQQISLRFDIAWGSGFAAYVDVLEAF